MRIMTIQAHITHLEQKHKAIEDEIANALSHRSIDDLVIADLTRRKLHIKDEIERLRDQITHSTAPRGEHKHPPLFFLGPPTTILKPAFDTHLLIYLFYHS